MFLRAAVILTSLSLAVANPVIGYGIGPSAPPYPAPPAPAPAPPAPAPQPITVNQCDTGSLQCCTSTSSSSDPSTSTLLGLLGVVVQGVSVPIGLGCTPISVIGIASGTSCSQAPLCCDQAISHSESLIGIDCSPITL